MVRFSPTNAMLCQCSSRTLTCLRWRECSMPCKCVIYTYYIYIYIFRGNNASIHTELACTLNCRVCLGICCLFKVCFLESVRLLLRTGVCIGVTRKLDMDCSWRAKLMMSQYLHIHSFVGTSAQIQRGLSRTIKSRHASDLLQGVQVGQIHGATPPKHQRSLMHAQACRCDCRLECVYALQPTSRTPVRLLHRCRVACQTKPLCPRHPAVHPAAPLFRPTPCQSQLTKDSRVTSRMQPTLEYLQQNNSANLLESANTCNPEESQ